MWTGGHVVVGASAPSTSLDLAEGYVASNFDEYLTVLNSNAAVANLTITYDVQGGAPVVKTMQVAANSRGTRLVNSDLPAGTSVSVHIDSDQPVVVERPMYFSYGSGWNGGHDAVAVADSTLGTSYSFAEGYVASNFDEYLTILNDTATDASITITYFLSTGGTQQVQMTVPAHSRGTHKVNSDFGVATPQSVQVSSTNAVKILVERPMYFAY
jgi:hypothetical protein